MRPRVTRVSEQGKPKAAVSQEGDRWRSGCGTSQQQVILEGNGTTPQTHRQTNDQAAAFPSSRGASPRLAPKLRCLEDASGRTSCRGEQRRGNRRRARVLPPGRGMAELVPNATRGACRVREEGDALGIWRRTLKRPVPKFSAILFLLISAASCRSCRACWAISSLATLEVMMKMASLQSMVFPFPSVSLPCNNTESTQAA